MVENEYKINPELVENVREFLMLRFSLQVIDRDKIDFFREYGGMPELQDADATLRKLFADMESAYSYVIAGIDEFGQDKDYVMDLLANEDAGPHEVLAFLDKFKPDYSTKN